MLKRFNLLSLMIIIVLSGVLGRIIINAYLSFKFYKENYASLKEYLKSIFTFEHYQLWWSFLFTTPENLLILLAVFIPVLLVIGIYLCYEIKDTIEEKRFKTKLKQKNVESKSPVPSDFKNKEKKRKRKKKKKKK